MVATSLLLHHSTCNFYFGPSYCFRRFGPSIRFRSYSSIISRGFLLSVSGDRSMTNLVKRFARRDGGSNEGNEQFGAVEQESFINDTSGLRNGLVAGGGIEAIVNRLVSKGISLTCAMCSMKCPMSVILLVYIFLTVFQLMAEQMGRVCSIRFHHSSATWWCSLVGYHWIRFEFWSLRSTQTYT